MPPRTGRFRRSDRILASADYRRVSRNGLRFADENFVMLVSGGPVGLEGPRLGITASRKVGNAVVRNRVKRSVREWFRRDRTRLPGGLDLVVIARPGARVLEGRQMEGDLEALLDQALDHPRISGSC